MLFISWFIAWTRFERFAAVQEFTFTPLWLSYILVINALTYQRLGRCMLTGRPRYMLTLFAVSACFWWTFEFLNRFVANWYYVGIGEFGALRYFIYASLAFATVLPAVLCTAEWLDSFPGLGAGLDRFKPCSLKLDKSTAVSITGIAAAGLVMLAIWPATLYPLLWLLPILLVIGLQSFNAPPQLVGDIETGDWRHIWTLALSGLFCGFFWELWNINSLAHWEYRIPHLQRFEIFAMPLLGYLGYLPFGIFCGLFADFILPCSEIPSRQAKK